jgi:hypothetical protein
VLGLIITMGSIGRAPEEIGSKVAAALVGTFLDIMVIKKAPSHHGGSWKVAYADFVTAMMAFFLVMWILGMDENVRKAIEEYFSTPVGMRQE